MSSSFQHRLKTWRKQRDLTHAEAAAYVNHMQTGDHITAETLEKFEAGAIPSSADRLLLDFFMTVNPPLHIVRSTARSHPDAGKA